MPIVIPLETSNFRIDYESNPAQEKGYVPPGTTTDVRGVLNAGFTVDAFPIQELSFESVGYEGFQVRDRYTA